MSDSERSDREMIANPDWGDDVDPKIETVLEHVHTRQYWAFQSSKRVRSLSEDELDALAGARLSAHLFLDPREHAELRAYEKSLNDMSPGDEYFEELSAAWGELIIDNVDLDSVDEVYQTLEEGED